MSLLRKFQSWMPRPHPKKDRPGSPETDDLNQLPLPLWTSEDRPLDVAQRAMLEEWIFTGRIPW